MTYSQAEHRAALGRLTRDPLICRCTPENPRHTSPWDCVTADQIAAWREREKPPACSDLTARRVCWLWLWFSQDPEARRLSGRPEALPFDDFDDARGMTRLEGMMFQDHGR